MGNFFCIGNECPMKIDCLRYKPDKINFELDYFLITPNQGQSCDYFEVDESEYPMDRNCDD